MLTPGAMSIKMVSSEMSLIFSMYAAGGDYLVAILHGLTRLLDFFLLFDCGRIMKK